jgi:uncharacterized membrane protein YbhN (UPF0104 family)
MERCGHQREPRSLGWTRWAGLAVVPVVFLVVPSLADFPARLVAGCPTWIALAALLELASILGFVGSFAGVFGGGMTRRQSVVAALRALGASTVLPGGGLVGPAIGVRSVDRKRASVGRLVRSTTAFTILTSAPSLAALALFGVGLWLGWPAGPRSAVLTLAPAGVAVALLVLTWLLGRRAGSAPGLHRPLPGSLRWLTNSAQGVREGGAEAGRLLGSGSWKLLGASLAYYAFDNAVLWAAFRAYGHEPPLSVIVMGYVLGSLATAVPIPGGLGALEGGLIGALVLYGAPAGPAAGAVLLYRGVSFGLAVALGATAWAINRTSAPAPPLHPAHSYYPL